MLSLLEGPVLGAIENSKWRRKDSGFKHTTSWLWGVCSTAALCYYRCPNSRNYIRLGRFASRNLLKIFFKTLSATETSRPLRAGLATISSTRIAVCCRRWVLLSRVSGTEPGARLIGFSAGFLFSSDWNCRHRDRSSNDEGTSFSDFQFLIHDLDDEIFHVNKVEKKNQNWTKRPFYFLCSAWDLSCLAQESPSFEA